MDWRCGTQCGRREVCSGRALEGAAIFPFRIKDRPQGVLESRWFPSNRRQLPSNRRRFPSNRRQFPSNRRQLPSPGGGQPGPVLVCDTPSPPPPPPRVLET